jgi:hypothetical protein
MPKLSQVSLTGGEVSPSLGARVDLARYATSLKTCRNFFVRATGGVSNRAGTEFVAELDSTSLATLIPFIYSVDQAYMLVFQEESLRVYSDGAFVQGVTPAKTITLIVLTGTVPNRFKLATTSAAHGYTVGQAISISGVVGTGWAASVNGDYTVLSTPSTTTFTFGKNVSSASGGYVSGGTVTANVDLATPYQSDDLASIRYTQSADVLTLVHQSYLPAEVTRLTANSFVWAYIADFNSGPFLDENTTAVTVTASAATGSGITLTASSSIFTADHIGALFRLDIEDLSSIPPWEPSKKLAATGANPLGLFRRASGKVYECTTNEVAGALGTFTGTVRPIHEEGAEADGDGNPIDTLATRAGVEWTYRHSLYGVARITAQAGTTATADVITYLPVVSPKTSTIWSFGAWSDEQGYPALVTYYQDRLVFANTPGQPQTEWASKTGLYHDFGTSSPLTADDAITQTLNARQINAIVDLIPLDQLLAMTASSSWSSPRRGETWTPQTIGFDPQSYFGASDVRSVIVGDNALFVERGNKRLREILFDLQIDKFGGGELTVLARHLFKTATIVDMDYAADPHGILWVVRSDGALIGLTYLKEQEVIGWHRHDTDGYFERVCVIPEDGRDAVYFVVRRTINGSTVRYLERLAERDQADILDSFFVDCGLTYDGRNETGATITISGASYAGGATVTLTASASLFAATDVGDVIQFSDIRIEITGYTSATVVTGRLHTPVPAVLQAVASADWTFARDTFAGLDHLEGETVSILADGSVLAQQVVSGGSVTLQYAAGVVHIGLPFTAEIETLDVTIFGGDPIRDRAKSIPRVAVVVEDTVGLHLGPDANNLDPLAMRTDEYYTDPVSMQTDVFTAHPATTWNKSGRVLIRQSDPLPATILSILPQIEIGGDA